jgi:hypothetical protein
MRLHEFFDDDAGEEVILEAKLVWARRGKKVVRKVRCTSGRRKGRAVASASSCGKRIDMKKRFVMKRTQRRFKQRIQLKARRTKRFNPTSKRVAKMNKR